MMRYVFEHPDEARATGMRAAEEARTKWTWDHSAAKIVARLDEIEEMGRHERSTRAASR
jgi:hypothetical protein